MIETHVTVIVKCDDLDVDLTSIIMRFVTPSVF